MSTYQELKGLKIKYLSSDTSGDRLKEGEVFYNSTDFKLKSFVSTAAWHSGGDLVLAKIPKDFSKLLSTNMIYFHF